jgi:hypothetical protein
MSDGERWTLMTRTITPDGYAKLVAEDRHLAAEFAQFRELGDMADALWGVAEAADEILGYCNQLPSPMERKLSLLMSLNTIEEVAERSDRQGDEIQASWCKLLSHKLVGGEWPPF